VLSFLGLAEEGPGKEHAYHLTATLVISALLIAVFFVFQKQVQPGIDNNSTLLGATWPSMMEGRGGDWVMQLRAKFDAAKQEIGGDAQSVQFDTSNPLPSIAELGTKYQPATTARGLPSTATSSMSSSAATMARRTPLTAASASGPANVSSSARAAPPIPRMPSPAGLARISSMAPPLPRRRFDYFPMTNVTPTASAIPSQPRTAPVIPAPAPALPAPRPNPTLAGVMSAAYRSTQPPRGSTSFADERVEEEVRLPSRLFEGLDEEDEEAEQPPALLSRPPGIPQPAEPYMPTMPQGGNVTINPLVQSGYA
jgi:hypothetical protein